VAEVEEFATLRGVFVVTPDIYGDERGVFIETAKINLNELFKILE